MVAHSEQGDRLTVGLASDNASIRLEAVMFAGAHPSDQHISVLIQGFSSEDDFFVRDMLTWALTQHNQEAVVAALLSEVQSPNDRVRAQCLHTFSKIARPDTWSVITQELLTDSSEIVAQTAWRTAVILCPESERTELAAVLCSQLGRGSDEVKLSLSSALVGLGDAAQSALEHAALSASPEVSAHARATQQIAMNPDLAFSDALQRAHRLSALKDAPLVDPSLIANQ